jgi:hypothetical protein
MTVRIRANANVMQFKRGQEMDLDEDEALNLLATGRFTFVSETIEAPGYDHRVRETVFGQPGSGDDGLDDENAAFNNGNLVQETISRARTEAARAAAELVDPDDEDE